MASTASTSNNKVERRPIFKLSRFATTSLSDIAEGFTPEHMQLLLNQLNEVTEQRPSASNGSPATFSHLLAKCSIEVNGQKLELKQLESAFGLYAREAIKAKRHNVHSVTTMVQCLLHDKHFTIQNFYPDFPENAANRIRESAWMLFQRKQNEASSLVNVGMTQRMVVIGKLWASTKDDERKKYSKKADKIKAEAKDDLNRWFDAHPELENDRHTFIKAEKAKVLKPCTAFDCYHNAKQQKYMDKGVIGAKLQDKLRRHFDKLSAADLEEYDTLAQARNAQARGNSHKRRAQSVPAKAAGSPKKQKADDAADILNGIAI